MSEIAIPPFDARCSAEATRDVVFLFQRKWRFYYKLPDGVENRGDGFVDEKTGEALSDKAVLALACEGEHFMVIYETELVFGSREEGEAYGQSRAYNYPEGWRVYGVPAEGKLTKLLPQM
jgi:hypothetical protein